MTKKCNNKSKIKCTDHIEIFKKLKQHTKVIAENIFRRTRICCKDLDKDYKLQMFIYLVRFIFASWSWSPFIANYINEATRYYGFK